MEGAKVSIMIIMMDVAVEIYKIQLDTVAGQFGKGIHSELGACRSVTAVCAEVGVRGVGVLDVTWKA